MPSADSWPLQVFYDGSCPICRREIAHYMARDRLHHVAWIDIAQPSFNPQTHGLDPVGIQQVMHARLPDGRVVTKVAAFIKIWEALPPGPITTPFRWLLKIPGALPIANIFYRAFARNRHRLTGRCTPESCPK